MAKPKYYTSYSDKKRVQCLFFDGDLKMLKIIQEELGVGEAEAIRTAVRTYAAILTHPRVR